MVCSYQTTRFLSGGVTRKRTGRTQLQAWAARTAKHGIAAGNHLNSGYPHLTVSDRKNYLLMLRIRTPNHFV